MIELPPQSTTPEPAPEITLGIVPPEVLIPDATSPDSVSQQIQDKAALLGRATDYDGLTYIEDGLVHVVRGCDPTRTEETIKGSEDPTAHDKVGPRIHRRDNDRSLTRTRPLRMYDTLQSTRMRPLYLDKERVPHERVTHHETLSIDVYELGRFSKVIYLHKDQFDEHLDNDGNAIGLFWFQDEIHKPTPSRNIPVNAPINRKESVWQAAIETQTRNALPSLEGLAWHHEGKDKRIVRQLLMAERTTGGWANSMAYEIVGSDAGGGLSKEIVKYDALKKNLDGISEANRHGLNMHFEVARPSRAVERQRMLGQIAMNHNAIDPEAHMILELGDCADLLTYPDLPDDTPGLELMRKKLLNDPNFMGYAAALNVLEGEMGGDKLLELAERMHANYSDSMKKLGLDLSKADASITTPLWDLAKQRYLADNPDIVTPNDKGMESGKSAGYTFDYRHKQVELVNRRVGEALDKRYIKRTPLPHKEYEYLEDGSVSEKLVIDMNIQIDIQSLMEDLPDSVWPKILALLEKVKPDSPQLSYADQVRLGRMANATVGNR